MICHPAISKTLNAGRFILASASPRRVSLLREAGFVFEIEPADIDESDVPHGLTPQDLALYLAREKARAVASRHASESWVVLAADTVVAEGSELFGKAESPEEALAILRRLSGTRQSVITGVSVKRSDGHGEECEAAESVVEMKALTEEQIREYVAGGEWRGKAGAYGIQDHDPDNDPFVKLVSGTFDNVVGLPVELTKRLLRTFGIEPKG